MLILISPAKQRLSKPAGHDRYIPSRSCWIWQRHIQRARQLSAPQISGLMELATNWRICTHVFMTGGLILRIMHAGRFTVQRRCLYWLQAETFNDADFDFSQQHTRMLSGLYGVLRPLVNAALSSGDGDSRSEIRAAKILSIGAILAGR